jgi:hypothetical protein
MRDSRPGATQRPSRTAVFSSSEKLACEWEARHDVAARRRGLDLAAALHRYLTQARIEEERHHRDRPAHPPTPLPGDGARHPDDFAAQHPLAATWLRWGEDPR